jgi:hypothetical protein
LDASSTGVDARAGKKTESLQQVLHRAHDARLLSTYRLNFSDSQAPADVVNALFVRATDDFVDGGRGFDVVFFEGKAAMDQQFRSITEIASAETWARGWITGYGDDLYSRN